MDLRPSSRRRTVTFPTHCRRLLTTDRVLLSAAYDEPAAAGGQQPCFVVSHGFTGSWRRPDNRRIAVGLRPYGGVLSFDFRGHGSSGGLTTVGDVEVVDLDTAVAYARWLGHNQIVTVGFSLGGSVVLRQFAHAPEQLRPDAVVAVSSPAFWFYRGTSPMRLMNRLVHHPAGRSVLRHGLGTRVTSAHWREPYPLTPEQAALTIAPTPLLVVHGDTDHYFPLEHPHAVLEAARAGAADRRVEDRAELWVEPGFGHAEAATTADLVDRIGTWALKALEL